MCYFVFKKGVMIGFVDGIKVIIIIQDKFEVLGFNLEGGLFYFLEIYQK